MTVIKSEFIGKRGSVFVYKDTHDDGLEVEQVSRFTPEQLNKVRQLAGIKVRVKGFKTAEKSPQFAYKGGEVRKSLT